MRNTTAALALSLISLVAAASAAAQLASPVWANPYSHIFPIPSGEIDPRPDTHPPKIAVLSPEGNSTINTNSLQLSFKVEVGQSESAYSPMILNVYYQADWLENKPYVYEYTPNASQQPNPVQGEYSTILNLTGIPEGGHSITIFATERGTYYEPPFSEWPMWALDFQVKSYGFQITGVSTVSFLFDVTPLTVTLMPIASEILSESGRADVPLNFTVNGSASKILYALDGQNNVTIAGNTTLAGLGEGRHTLTVYAVDPAGNVGSSDTLSFFVDAPFPTTSFAAMGMLVAVVAVAAMVYVKKRRR